MPAFSGLYDGVHGDGYAALDVQSRPPMLRGITRVIMQKRGMHGTVNVLGGGTPDTIAQIDADRGDITVPGTFNWPARTLDRDMTITNIESHASDSNQDVTETVARVPDASADDLNASLNTTLNNEYAGDDAISGVTAPPLEATP